MVTTFGACLRALRVLLPRDEAPEAPSLADEASDQIHRVHKRMAEVLEMELEKMLGGAEQREERENKLV